ncbi:sugar O-acyltransferase, sialic acid O-acetyltransferase NeuD family [Rhodonellum ikkaensis]|nr:sugar O-acyltransferase, sialic acid O-acetyltransferase NeuD family [Rhodonellum ikkaensis]
MDAGYKIAGYFDFQKAEKNPYSLKYFGFENNVDIQNIVQDHLVFPSVGENTIREKLIGFFELYSLNQFVAIDPSALISKTASINVSTYIGKHVSVNAQSKIGKGVIINTNCVVEHECTIKDYVHLAPGGVLCGNVAVGRSTFIGANSVVKQNTKIADNVIVGAGSVVVKNIHEKGIWVGNPAKYR